MRWPLFCCFLKYRLNDVSISKSIRLLYWAKIDKNLNYFWLQIWKIKPAKAWNLNIFLNYRKKLTNSRILRIPVGVLRTTVFMLHQPILESDETVLKIAKLYRIWICKKKAKKLLGTFDESSWRLRWRWGQRPRLPVIRKKCKHCRQRESLSCWAKPHFHEPWLNVKMKATSLQVKSSFCLD